MLSDGTVPSHIGELLPYQPGKPIEEVRRQLGLEHVVKIASNENPLGPSPLALKAMATDQTVLSRYPDAACHKLTSVLAEQRGVPQDEIVATAGSNELIGLAMRAFCQPGRDNVVMPQYSFISYKLQAKAQAIESREVAPVDGLRCNVEGILAQVDEFTKIVFVAHPNNPTGAHLSNEELATLIRKLPARIVLIIDEAYYEYAVVSDDYTSAEKYRGDRERLIITRTFSKAYGLAGVRVGYGISTSEITGIIHRGRRPFNVNTIAQTAACAAASDDDFLKASQKQNTQCIAEMQSLFDELNVRHEPTRTNFILAKFGPASQSVHDALLNRGLIVRPMANWGLPDYLRISTYHENDREFVHRILREVCAS